MKWSIKLVTIAGIGVYMHLTFLLLLGWMAFGFYRQGQSLTEILTGMVSVLLLFVVVVLHEFGHALTARRFGIGTRDITLLPIGGVARLERMPEDPKQELLVALAGPAVNVALAVGIFLLLLFTGSLPQEVPQNIMQEIPLFLLGINIMLALFNMLPAFPMDGGRVLRALLAMRMEYVSATQIAAQIGQAMALLFGFVGLFANPFLIFIALFVWIAASEEAGMVQMKTAMSGMPISKAMITRFQTVSPSQSLQEVAQLLLDGFQQDFPVVYRQELVGVLTRPSLIKALKEKGDMARVDDVMEEDFQTADPAEMMENVFIRLRECQCRSIPILRDGELVGLVTMENLGEFIMVEGAQRVVRLPR